jgi:hypothetical protein
MKTIMLVPAWEAASEFPHPAKYRIIEQTPDHMLVAYVTKSTNLSTFRMSLKKLENGQWENENRVPYVEVKQPRGKILYRVLGHGIDGKYNEPFRSMAALQKWVRDHWQGAEFIDGPAEFHTDYVRWTIVGATLADLGHRGPHGTDEYWDWSWKTVVDNPEESA